MKIVSASYKYWEFIRQLRNDDRVKSGFIKQLYINEIAHEEYMKKNSSRFRVCLVDDEPAGYVRVNSDGDIAVAVHPDFQKRGVGKALIKHITLNFPGCFAKIKLDNEASKALFESCGYKQKYIIMEPR